MPAAMGVNHLSRYFVGVKGGIQQGIVICSINLASVIFMTQGSGETVFGIGRCQSHTASLVIKAPGRGVSRPIEGIITDNNCV